MAHFGQPRVYPNLNPSAAVPVDRDQVFALSSFAEHYRMRRGKERGQYVPNARFTFVKLTTGETLLHQRFRHPALAQGRPVLYAGEAYFNNGRLDWWSNGSGNYRPDPDHAAQAGLPMEQFFTHDQILKGAHTQPKRDAASPKSPTAGATHSESLSGIGPATQLTGVQAKFSPGRSLFATQAAPRAPMRAG